MTDMTIKGISEEFFALYEQLEARLIFRAMNRSEKAPIGERIWKVKETVEILQQQTKYKWTTDRLLTLAVNLGWRDGIIDKAPSLDHRYYTNGVVSPAKDIYYPFQGYTETALKYIIENPDACWARTDKKLCSKK